MVPQVETVEDIKHIVSAAKFGKKINGTRSAPPGRWLPGVSDIGCDPEQTLWTNLNEQAAIIIQVESKEAVDNLDDILTEAGKQIDAVWLGSLDCRVSMGLPGFWGEEPEFLAVLDTLNRTLRKHDMPYAGAAMGPPEQMAGMGQGKAFTAIQGDVFSMVAAAQESLKQAREVLPAVNISAANKKAREENKE
jgi:2-keto-3-deoxy-L-rhamnonate aldolase RhmA